MVLYSEYPKRRSDGKKSVIFAPKRYSKINHFILEKVKFDHIMANDLYCAFINNFFIKRIYNADSFIADTGIYEPITIFFAVLF